jgi:hypothetical protein
VRRANASRTAVAVLVALVALGLTACGDDGDGGEESSQTTLPATTAAPQGQPIVSIDMVDHAFQVSGPLVAGGTLKLANRGSEFHMIGFARFKPGRTIGDLQRVLNEAAQSGGGTTTTTVGTTTTTARGATTTTTRASTTTSARAPATTSTTAPDPTADIVDTIGLPGGFMGPGESVELTVPTLQPGTYALVCYLPTEGEGTPHFAKGMVGQLEILPGPAPAPPTADATYRLAAGKAIEGPATLTAGRHTLKFEAAAGSQQLEPAIARLNAGTSFERLETALTNIFESDTPPAKGAASRVPGQIVFGGFDLGDVTTFYLTADFKVGNYVLVAEDTDVNSPGAPKELINVRVS